MPDPGLVSDRLRYFLATVEHGSVTAAARALRVSQPSLSVALRKLEDELGAQLLHRERRGVRPTRAGEVLLAHARQASLSLGAAVDEIRALADDPRGSFVLGCHESLGAYFLPGFMGRFLAAYPGVELTLHNANSREVEEAVVARRVDVGLVVNPRGHPDCVVTELFEDRVAFVVSAALHRREGGEPAALFGARPLLHVPVLAQTQYLRAALTERGVAAPRQIACSSMELVKSLVLDGVGVGILPMRVATHGVARGRLVLVAEDLPAYRDRIALVRRADQPPTAGARVLVSGLREHGRGTTPIAQVLAAPGAE